MNLDFKEIQTLIRMLDETDVAEISLESDGAKIHIRKASAVTAAPTAPADHDDKPDVSAVRTAVEERSNQTPAVAAPAAQPADEPVSPDWIEVKAPVVGTFYRAPAPDAPPFIEVGDQVQDGQTLCIIEAMKLMNEIPAESRGRIRRILVDDGTPVEYGQPLFLVEPV